jgi:cytochrome c peroxidase
MSRKINKKLLLPLGIAFITAGCNSDDNATVDASLQNIITANSLTGDPMSGRIIPDISSQQAQLGMRLFFSKSLGGDRDSACVTCHHPSLGGGDVLSLPIGVGATDPDLLGPGRLHDNNAVNFDGGPPVPRNAPTTFNIAGWDSVLFHDGRVESLGKTPDLNGDDGVGIRTPDVPFDEEDVLAGQNLPQAQARFPVTSPEEMKGFNHDDKDNQGIRDFLASRLGDYDDGAGELADPAYWLNKFRTTFSDPTGTARELITEQNISFLIGEYERSQSFIDTPWKRYVEGDDTALSESAKKGALLFFNSQADGGANCSSCHSGDFFTDEKFHNLAMPQIGRGKGDGTDGTDDFGRFRETQLADDLYTFRTPSLINVEVTGPWSHAGAYTSLEAVVRHTLNPADALNSYDTGQLTQPGIQNLDKIQINTQKALAKLEDDRLAGKDVIKNTSLTDVQVGELVEFLKSLTDPCVKDRNCLASWIVDPINDVDPNGDQLDAIDDNGDLL